MNIDATLVEVEKIVNGLGLPIDPKIKRTVAVLRALGFDTEASCEGHQDYTSPEGKIDLEKWGRYDKDDKICYPWVEICYRYPASAETKKEQTRLQSLVQKYNDHRILVEEWPWSLVLRTKCSSLEEGQQVMSDFTEWLLKQ